jgi:hypothetical protein
VRIFSYFIIFYKKRHRFVFPEAGFARNKKIARQAIAARRRTHFKSAIPTEKGRLGAFLREIHRIEETGFKQI